MNNPQTPNRPQSTQHKQEPNARISNQQSKARGPNNKNSLDADTTSGTNEKKDRQAMERDERSENGSKMNKEEV